MVEGKKIFNSEGSRDFYFHCPGCETSHKFWIDGKEPSWTFNDDFDKPTIRPSYKVQARHLCHSWITNGEIHFLSDSTHHLKAKLVPLPDHPFYADQED